jgi:hypothetical protein
MNNQKILDNAPEGATHVDNEGDYWLMHPDNQVETFMDGSWLYCNPQEPLRSLADIKHIAELEKEVVKANMKLIDCALDIAELEAALRWSRDSNTGYEPSLSVMQRYYDDLIPKAKGG